MVVLWITIIVFIDGAAFQLKAFQQSRIYEFTQCSIDSRGTDIVVLATSWQTLHQLFCVKVFVIAEDLADQELSLGGLPEPPRLQILFKSRFRRERDFKWLQRGVLLGGVG